MDVFVHAVVGAFTGHIFGHPVLGAMVAAAPDLGLWSLRRRNTPTAGYNAAHSGLCALAATLGAALLFTGPAWALVALCLLSHLVLDLPTHGSMWAPTLLYPFSKRRYSFGEEWEFFNDWWFDGLILALTWVALCLLLSFALPNPPSPIGFRW